MRSIQSISLNLLLSLLIVFGCSDSFTDNPQPNQAPKTFVSIFSNRNLSPTTSRITINWWGDDPDGLVVGFVYTFDPNAPDVQTWSNDSPDPNWTFTTKTQETFTLTLAGTDTIYTIWVKAIDDANVADSEGAIQDFSIMNSRPVVEFPVATDVPETTFTVVNFVWSGSDLDGNDTIAKFQYALDDTISDSNWLDLEPNRSSLTLTAADGLTEGEHVFFLRAIDLAGATSDVVRMPRQENNIWYVREPSSSFLIVDDYNVADNVGVFYQTTLQAIVGPVDIWDIKSNSNALEPASPIAFTKTLQLFERIFWYSDSAPNLIKAQASLADFLDSGGKLIMSTTFQEFASNQGDPLDFSPADSLGTKISRLLRNQLVLPTQPYASQGFPDLQVNTGIIPFIFPVVPKISSEILYVLPENLGVWQGTPPMGVINGASTFVFFGLPLASLDGQGTVSQLFDKILNEIF